MTPETRTWLDRPELARLWDRLSERLQRNGLSVRGRVQLRHVDDEERQALSLLTGNPFTQATVSVSLPELDMRLRRSAAECGLVEVVTALRGTLVDRPAARLAYRSAYEHTWQTALVTVENSGLATNEWVLDWLTDVRRTGTIGRLGTEEAGRIITQAVDILARILVRRETLSRGELAERVTGTTHGLDDDTVLARMVLRGLARSTGQELPADLRGRRELWESVGVSTDAVSTTVLTYGLMPLGDDWWARHLRERAAAYAETHLTLRDLRRMSWHLPPNTDVFVCENPRVVEAAADEQCAGTLVCTSGNPATVVLYLLDALAAAGARIAYRGDFDWPGVAIANRVIGRYDARPWRMSAADYEEHVEAAQTRDTPLRPLTGTAIEARWDPELTPAMRALGVAVQEESALELLLADLRHVAA